MKEKKRGHRALWKPAVLTVLLCMMLFAGVQAACAQEAGEPAQPTVPTTSTDPTDPMDPTDPTGPTDPTDPVEPSEPIKNGWDGKCYYVDGEKLIGKYMIDGVLYSFKEDSGEYWRNAFTVYENKMYYCGSDGKGMPYTGVCRLNDLYYKDGKKFTGTKDNYYYKSGKKFTGTANGYYYKGGKKYTGTVNGCYYKSGKKFTGTKDGYYYKSGKKFTGTSGSYYYKGGKKYTGTAKGYYYKGGKKFTGIKGSDYYSSGKISRKYKSTVKSVDGTIRYFFSSGKVKTSSGWVRNNGNRYYFKSGKGVTGWNYVGSYKYYFKSNGVLVQDLISYFGSSWKKKDLHIKVNRQRNCVTLYAKDGGKGYTIPVKALVCSVGKKSTPTIRGTYTLTKSKTYRWHTLGGPTMGGYSYGQYCTRISGGYLFHSLNYRKPNNRTLIASQYNSLGNAASHGCIRLKAGDAKLVYDIVRYRNTTVVIYDSSTASPFDKPTVKKISNSQTYDPTDPNI